MCLEGVVANDDTHHEQKAYYYDDYYDDRHSVTCLVLPVEQLLAPARPEPSPKEYRGPDNDGSGSAI